MSILEAIELRLYRYEQAVQQDPHARTDLAKRFAEQILNLTTENYNRLMESGQPKGGVK